MSAAGASPTPRRSRLLAWAAPLRFLLVWPLVTAVRHQVRRSLRWRLAQSHLGTVFLSILAISVIGAAGTVLLTFLEQPVKKEPATEAAFVANVIAGVGLTDRLNTRQTSALLESIATGAVGPNEFDEDVTVLAGVGRRFANIRSISVVDTERKIVASSEPALIGQSVLQAGPAAPGVAQRALAGSTDAVKNSVVRAGTVFITGAYPIYASPTSNEIVGAVVVDKAGRNLPPGFGIVMLVLKYVGILGLTIAILVGIPAIPVGVIVGLRGARAISRPVSRLARTAEAIAGGNLHARTTVDGEDELAVLGRAFNDMADKLEVSMQREAALRVRAETLLKSNRDLIANVSHELRTPVALVRGHLEALGSEPEQMEEYTRIALRETDRLERLVEDLFQLTRVESQGIKLERVPFDAGSAAREAVESLAEPARRDAGIVMQVHVEEGDLRCVGDRARLVQVLQNLIRNAIRFTPEGGIILASVCEKDDAAEIVVRDTGTGIPPADVPHVFERFYRSEQSRNRSGGGAGLGLAIAKELIEAMGGTIAVESVIDEGSAFTIRLPLAAKVAANGVANGAKLNGTPVPATEIVGAGR